MKESYRIDSEKNIFSVGGGNSGFSAALPFQVDSCGKFDCGEKYYTSREGRNDYLMIFTLSGQGEADTGQGMYPLTAGSVTVIDCMKRHFYQTAPGKRWKFLFVHFYGQTEAFIPLLASSGPVLWPEDTELFENSMEEIIRATERKDLEGSLICSDLLTRLLTHLACLSCREKAENAVQRYVPALNELCAFLRKHYEKAISLEEMARRMNLSKYHFIRIFSAYTHATPAAYLKEIRLHAACALLMTEECSVQEIAERTGFSDAGSLVRSFRSHFGITPARYRKQWRQ